MSFLDPAKLDAIDAAAFQRTHPYPWVNPAGLLGPDAYRELYENLPGLSLFQEKFGKTRKYGQKPHDRYALEWEPGLELPAPWRAFIEELQGDVYAAFLRRVLGLLPDLRFHWHYTPRGCSVSPHCDSKRKLGSHIFYFNNSDEWDPAWGGETLVLDDGGRFDSDSHPEFEDFQVAARAESLDNRSFIFLRRGDSWHGVREITCPEGRLRKVFIVVFDRPAVVTRIRNVLGWKGSASA